MDRLECGTAPTAPRTLPMNRRAIFLDFGGTLCETRASLLPFFREAARRAHVELPWDDYLRANDEAWNELWPEAPQLVGQIPAFADRVHERALRRIGFAGPTDRLVEYIREEATSAHSHRPFPEVESTLRALRAAGLPLHVISGHVDYLPVILANLGWSELFETVTFSQQVGAQKPDPRVFRYALSRAGAEPGDSGVRGGLLGGRRRWGGGGGDDRNLAQPHRRAGAGPLPSDPVARRTPAPPGRPAALIPPALPAFPGANVTPTAASGPRVPLPPEKGAPQRGQPRVEVTLGTRHRAGVRRRRSGGRSPGLAGGGESRADRLGRIQPGQTLDPSGRCRPGSGNPRGHATPVQRTLRRRHDNNRTPFRTPNDANPTSPVCRFVTCRTTATPTRELLDELGDCAGCRRGSCRPSSGFQRAGSPLQS